MTWIVPAVIERAHLDDGHEGGIVSQSSDLAHEDAHTEDIAVQVLAHHLRFAAEAPTSTGIYLLSIKGLRHDGHA